MIPFIILTFLSIFTSTLAFIKLKAFQKQYSALKNEDDLEQFKSLVRTQMYLALPAIAFLLLTFLVGFYYLFFTDEIGFISYFAVNAFIYFYGKVIKASEDQVKSLETWDATSQKEYRDICQSWFQKALPDF